LSETLGHHLHRTGNPVIPVYSADPDAHLFGDKYFIYATNAGFYSDKETFLIGQAADVEHGFAAWSSQDLQTWLNSTFIAVTTLVFQMLFSSMAGYALARIPARGSKIVFFLLVIWILSP